MKKKEKKRKKEHKQKKKQFVTIIIHDWFWTFFNLVGGWMGVKSILRIAYSNKKIYLLNVFYNIASEGSAT